MRHLYKALFLLAILVLMVSIHRKSTSLEDPEPVFDIPVSAATRPSVQLSPSETLTATRPADALAAPPSDQTWAQAIDTVLRENLEVTEKSRRMMQLLPHLPASLQTEAAQHLVNFATDQAPQSVVEPLVNCHAGDAAQGVLLLGLLQRADKIRLPALLEIARNADHPKSGQALQYLQFLLETDYGADWSRWQQAIDARLAPRG